MSGDALRAHSLVEACLYLRVIPCPLCRNGSLDAGMPEQGADPGTVRFVATCRNCGAADVYCFRVAEAPTRVDPVSSSAAISRDDAPSEIIDAVQWVTLAEIMLESAEDTPDAAERRWRRIRAAQCLDEALKFYEPGNELPPAAALFAEASRAAVRDFPQRYARSRLVARREELPVPDAVDRVADVAAGAARRKPWWRFW